MDSPTIEVARGQGELTPSTVDIVHPDLACPLTKSRPSGSTCRSSVAQLTTDNLREARVALVNLSRDWEAEYNVNLSHDWEAE